MSIALRRSQDKHQGIAAKTHRIHMGKACPAGLFHGVGVCLVDNL